MSDAAGATRPIKLYYWPTPNGHKITIMLEECGLPYEIHFVNLGKKEQFSPEFEKISPNQKIPAIVDPNGPLGEGAPEPRGELAVFESGAILQYLGRKTKQFYPLKEPQQTRVEQWLHWQMGGLGPFVGQAWHFIDDAPEEIEYAIERYEEESERLIGVMNKHLKGRDFLADDYSIADIACWPWVRSARNLGISFKEYAEVGRWFAAIEARPAVQRAMAIKKPQEAQ